MMKCSVCEQEFEPQEMRATWYNAKDKTIYTCKPCFQEPKSVKQAKPKKVKKVKKDEPLPEITNTEAA